MERMNLDYLTDEQLDQITTPFAEIIAKKVSDISERVWHGTVSAYEANGLHKAQAYAPAEAARDAAVSAAAITLAKGCQTLIDGELVHLPDYMVHIVAEKAITMACG
jgi:hypothetical protein